MFRHLSVLIFFICISGIVSAQAIWTDVAEPQIVQKGERRIVPQVYRTVRLDVQQLTPLLHAAPERFTPDAAKQQDLPVLTIPMPDGSKSRFRLTESPVMAPALQAQYPEIRCYTGYGIDDPTATIKCDLTPKGFHAMVRSALQSAVFIDPYSEGDQEHYVVYYKKDYAAQPDDQPFACEADMGDLKEIALNDQAAKLQGDCQLRKYRLALACTGEYAIFHGGTTQLALAAMNTTMNRVNGVYENDFAVTMEMVANNDQIVYLNASTDPYSNGNASTMLGQNQTTCTNVIGSANFDIGHVFGTNSGGIASLGVVCSNNNKARGVTGSGAPIGDPFDIDYVAHEMGHQFGGSHTFNGTIGSCSGNGSSAAAVEPGSGSTIMAYAGICGSQNIQSNSDDYFHAYSIQQINNFTVNGNGNNCPVKIASGNNNPSVDGGNDYIIPKSTPFALTATGSDPDGDMLTYCWEQMDAGVATAPPVATSTTGPLFRSFKGTASPTRYFPRLPDLVSNTNYAWEELPGVARTMNFRVELRDNHPGAGCTDEDDVQLTVTAAAGPFTVMEPNTNVLWFVGENKTVTWDVSNTDQAPVNCASVRIVLSVDGGFNYPVVLADDVPNTGSASIVVPDNVSSTCRVKVEAVGNVFFDISNQNFRIEQPPVPTFSLLASTTVSKACPGDTIAITASIGSILNFSDPVDLDLSGFPAGASVTIDPNPVAPGSNASILVYDLTSDMAGSYNLNIQGVSGSIIQNSNIVLDVLAGLPDATSAMSPADGTSGLPLAPTLEWTAASGAETYFLQVATNPAFPAGSIVFSETQSGTTAQLPALDPGVVYYWRVRADNFCGETAFSDYFSFQTARLDCGHTYNSEDVPVAISPDDIVTVNSTLDIAEDRSIAAVSIDLLITHTYVGDLDARLLGPDGTNILLFDRPGVPASNFGCSGNNIDVVLSDDAPLSAGELESACSNPPPAISGNYQPLEALSAFNGKSTMGEWQLIVGDYFADDGGSITSWSLSFCFSDSIPPGSFVANNVLMVGTGGAGTITDAYLELTLSGDAEQGLFTLLSLPQHGVLTLNGDTLQFGDTFTQADINAGLLVYTHNGDGATEDQFEFDAVDLNNASWSHNAVFHIVIVPNNLAATAEASGDVLCPGSATGEITVTATGLDGQYLYSLNGGPDQDSNVFTDLPAGTYTVVVTGQFGFTTTTNEVVLEDPDPMQVGVDVVDDDVTVNVTGGAGNLQYSLNGVDFQPENTFVDLPNGFYTVTVMDENGCTVTAEFTVAVNTLVVNLEVQSEVSCFDGSDGAIVVTVGGGQMPYSYSLNGGPFQPENVFDGLPAGTYSVEVKDDQGFTVVSNEVTLAAPPAIMVDAAVALNVITVTASGGTGNLEYSLNGVDFQPDNVFENLPNDLYTVVVRDEKGCTATATALVDVAPLAVVTIDFTADILCFGDETAAIEVVASGGIPPYEYAIDGGTYQSSNVFTGLGGGPHSVSVRDAAGTEVQSALFFINQPSPLVAIVNLDGNDAQFMATGGTGPYQFSFDGPNPPVNLPNGDYALTVTDANGCTNVAMFTVNIPPLMLSGEITNIDNCAGEAVVELSATGGEPPYEYSLNGGPFQSSPVFTIFTGNNIVRVRDATGTIVQIPVPLQLNPPVELAVSVSNDTITASAQLGTPPYMYSINGMPFQDSPVFPGVPNGDYTVIVEDANGCQDTVLVMVTSVISPADAWGLIIAPNPSAGRFVLSMQEAPSDLHADVFDAVGRKLHSFDYTPAGGYFSEVLDLQHLPQGTYLLRFSDGQHWGSALLSIVK